MTKLVQKSSRIKLGQYNWKFDHPTETGPIMTLLKLNHFSQQPVWLRDNHYLHNNHRAPTQSYLMCLRSCFMLHTETMNIWLVG